MQTRHLKTLVAISKVGSFAKAADQLNMTLPALSMQMKSLEAELGAMLFDRSVRPPRLTPRGRAVVEAARPILEGEAALVEVCRPGDALVGRFRIGFVTTAAVRLLPGFLEAARVAAPRAAFDVETGLSRALQEKVTRGQLDAAVLTDADGLPPALKASVLREEPFVYAAHERLLGRGLSGLLAEHTFFHFMPDTGIGKVIATEMARHVRPAGAQSVMLDNLEAIMECVRTGLGFTLLPAPDVTRYASPDVQTRPVPHDLKRTLVLATLRDSPLARQEKALLALLGRNTGK